MKKLLILASVLTCLFSFSVDAAPVVDQPFYHTQPDGSVVELYRYGDEYYSFTGDADGYAMRLNEQGAYEYVTAGKNLRSSLKTGSRPANTVKGFDLKPETIEDNSYGTVELNGPMYDDAVFYASKVEPEDFVPLAQPKTTKLLVVAVDFTDAENPDVLEHTLSEEFYSPEKICNLFFPKKENPGDDIISINSYFDEVSGGLFSFEPAFTMPDDYTYVPGTYGKVGDGIIKVKLGYPHPGTEENGEASNSDIRKIVSDAVTYVDTLVDFSEYNRDGYNDRGYYTVSSDELTITFIIAGYEASAANNEYKSIHAHSGNIGGINGVEHPITRDYDEGYSVWLADSFELVEKDSGGNTNLYSGARYAMVGAMYNDSTPMGVGTFCHELSHVIGLPDLYNAEISANDYGKISTLSLMSAGNWGTLPGGIHGHLPTHLDAWSKLYLGWFRENEYKEINYDEVGNYDLCSAFYSDDLTDNKLRYIKVNTKDPGEYYILENRSLKGFDRGLEGYYEWSKGYGVLLEGGIAIYHVDEDVIYEQYSKINGYKKYRTRFEANRVNACENPGVKLIRVQAASDGNEDKNRPLWRYMEGSISMFGKNTLLASNLNTYTADAQSGVSIKFMNGASDKMNVEFGSHMATAVTKNSTGTTVHMVNESDKPITLIPFIEKSSNGKVYELDAITVPANGEGSVSSSECKFSSGEGYKAVYIQSSEDETVLSVYNGGGEKARIRPIIAQAGGGELLAFTEKEILPGETTDFSQSGATIKTNKEYKMFNFDFKTLKPFTKAMPFKVAQ